jgi:hypothetical protein
MDPFMVNYTNPLLGADPPIPSFVLSENEKNSLPPDGSDILRRQELTKDIIKYECFNFPTSDNGVVSVPYHILHHKSLKTLLKITGNYNVTRHCEYIFRSLCPNLNFSQEDVIQQIQKFGELTSEISADICLSLRGYYHLWIFNYFIQCCDLISMIKRPDVCNYADAFKYAGHDIKACYVLLHAINEVGRTINSYPRNKELLVGWVMEHRKMVIVKHPTKTVQFFPVRLVRSCYRGIIDSFTGKYGTKFGPNCKWEIRRFRISAPSFPLYTRPAPRPRYQQRSDPSLPPPGGADPMNFVGPSPDHKSNSIVHNYHLQVHGNHRPPFLPAVAASAIPASQLHQPPPASDSASPMVGSCIPLSPPLNQTQSVIPSSVTPSNNTGTTPPPPAGPKPGPILFTNSVNALPSLNIPPPASGASILPSNSSAVSPTMDPLTREMNTVNERAKLSEVTAATPAIAPDPAAVEVSVGVAPGLAAVALAVAPTVALAVAPKVAPTVAKRRVLVLPMAEKKAAEQKKIDDAAAVTTMAMARAAEKATAAVATQNVVEAKKAKVVAAQKVADAAAAINAQAAVAAQKVVETEKAAKAVAAQKVAKVAAAKNAKAAAVATKLKAAATKSKAKRDLAAAEKADRESEVDDAAVAESFCSSQKNHPDKDCSFDCLINETHLKHYGITGEDDDNGPPSVCGNQSSKCCLPNEEAWKTSFKKKKPILYVCKHCISIIPENNHPPPFFICKLCYEAISMGHHEYLTAPSRTRTRNKRRKD